MKTTKENFYQSTGHTRHCLLYHFVIVPKYRRPILFNGTQHIIRSVIEQHLPNGQSDFICYGGSANHYHFIVRLQPAFDIPAFIRKIKTESAKLLKALFKRPLQQFDLNNHFWGTGYFVRTVGADVSQTMRYVEAQFNE